MKEEYVFWLFLKNPKGGLNIDNVLTAYDRKRLRESTSEYRLKRVKGFPEADVYKIVRSSSKGSHGKKYSRLSEEEN